MQTALTRQLGIAHPIVSAGMARVSQGPLVVAVSNAGGMGCLGGVSYLPDALRRELRWIRRHTDRPYAVNVLLPDVLTSESADTWQPVRQLWEALDPPQRTKLRGVEPLLTPGAVAGQVEVVLAERPPVVVLTFATPSWFVEACHQRDIQVMALVGSIGAARRAQAADVDFIVAQGTEGGGHTGHVGTMALVPALVDAVTVPVLAAGGIVDGRGVAAALCLGAAGVWIGTRFIASDEAYGHPAFKERITSAATRDTVLTRAYTGKPLRTLRNAWTDAWQTRTDEIVPFPGQYAKAGVRVETGYQDGDLHEGMMPAGQGIELIQEVKPAGQIVAELVAEAERILTSTPAH